MKVVIDKFIIVNKEKLKAVADIIVNDSVVIRNIKLIDYNGKMFAMMPARKALDEYKDVVFPTTREFATQISNILESEYQNKKYDAGVLEEMRITDVRVQRTAEENKEFKAIASVVFNNCLAIASIFIVQKSPNDFQFVLPSVKQSDGNYKTVVDVLSQKVAETMFHTIFGEYKKLL